MSNGGPAFPSHGTMGEVAHQGMTLRDYFAASVDMPWNAVIECLEINGTKNPTIQQIANYRASYKFCEADAMLKQREVQP